MLDDKLTEWFHKGWFWDLFFFVIFFNDRHQAIKKSSVHHFAGDTNLLLIDK